jgi:hypothetical protein
VGATYEIRLRGTLSGPVRGAFDELEIRGSRGDTILRGHLPDQASLHGVLNQAQRLGLELIELRQVKDAPG